ncbi:MAG: hypothetical protein IH935_12370, partial [Acidobacteria bacterium]|nr:hypothetical protein [Acidobacteriota bacterium]
MDSAKLTEEFFTLTETFLKRAARLGLGDLRNYYWYHTVDLGDGLVTPGMYDFRETLSSFQFPADMSGMRVLDVGSATGFFVFEFEKRGASVTSVELPSLDALDRFPGQTTGQVLEKIERMLEPYSGGGTGEPPRRHSPEKLYFYLLDGAFRFCSNRLNSKAARYFSTVYNLSADRLGANGFDLVFLGDLLVHTLDPLRALAAVAPLCNSTLVLSQTMPQEPAREPAMLYVGGDDPREDELSWWWPNKPCFEQML